MSLKAALNDFGYDVTNGAKKILKQRNKNTSKRLSNSLDYVITSNGKKDKYTLSFTMENYGEFIDRGVKGKGGTKKDGSKWKKKRISNTSIFKQGRGFTDTRPPASAFSDWTVRRGIAPRNNKGQFTSRKSLMFAIAESVYRTGVEATNFFSTPFKREFKKLPDELAEGFGLEVERKLKKTILKITKPIK